MDSLQTPYGIISQQLHHKLTKIKMVISDVDGVLSDGKIYLTNTGDEIKNFNVRDGFGIVAIQKHCNIAFAVITGRESNIVKQRMQSLKVTHIYQGVTDKVPYLKKIMSDCNLQADEIAYIGDDVIDIPVLQMVGFSACPHDAHLLVQPKVDYICQNIGGNGAVREICDLLLCVHQQMNAIGASI